MKLSEFTNLELQKIRSHYSLDDLARLFEGDISGNKAELARRTQPPVNFVRSQPIEWLVAHLVEFGYPRAAEMFGVSESFLKREIVSRSVYTYTMGQWTRPELEKIINVAAVAKLFGFKIKGDLTNGNHSSHLGRKGELMFAKLRGDQIITDYNAIDPRSPFDFHDTEYGHVNVKTSKPHHRKDLSTYWKFNKNLAEGTDHVACVALGGDGSLKYVVMVKPADLGPAKSFIMVQATIAGEKGLIYGSEE